MRRLGLLGTVSCAVVVGGAVAGALVYDTLWGGIFGLMAVSLAMAVAALKTAGAPKKKATDSTIEGEESASEEPVHAPLRGASILLRALALVVMGVAAAFAGAFLAGAVMEAADAMGGEVPAHLKPEGLFVLFGCGAVAALVTGMGLDRRVRRGDPDFALAGFRAVYGSVVAGFVCVIALAVHLVMAGDTNDVRVLAIGTTVIAGIARLVTYWRSRRRH